MFRTLSFADMAARASFHRPSKPAIFFKFCRDFDSPAQWAGPESFTAGGTSANFERRQSEVSRCQIRRWHAIEQLGNLSVNPLCTFLPQFGLSLHLGLFFRVNLVKHVHCCMPSHSSFHIMTAATLSNGVSFADSLINGSKTSPTRPTNILKFGGKSAVATSRGAALTGLRDQCGQISSGYSKCGQVEFA
jgi:hypothetical protein